ncbi:two-component system sensor histidine kinase YesM [Paenibacillus endophyticus]|uniref:Two-component system sensor histidine kinase YesM n=1 Tax=Paenibacillus endophyticus TaxID=1294268 RepID=A0A7W5GCV3_9BACL|nr:sensor histidine kinase [Paenibacillus endophyticus]MBB3155260.1 two-component system sensor histidine kinase YesM [Paenibacillus endophyticus]
MPALPKFISIRTKMLFLLCCLITVPFLLSGMLTYQKYSANMERDARTSSEQIVEQVSINLERYIKEMERITMSLYYDDHVSQILEMHTGAFKDNSYLRSDELFKMSQMISSVIYERTEVEGIFIFALDGSLFSNLQETAKISWKPTDNSWMETARAKDGGLVILPPNDGSYYLEKPRRVISLARLLKDPLTNQVIGYVKVDLTSKGFEKILTSIQITENSKLYIFNEKGETIFPFSGEDKEEIPVNTSEVNTSKMLVSERETSYGGLHIQGIIPKSDLQSEARQLISYTLWISLASLFIAFLASVFTSNRLVKPIRHLHMKMKRVQNGELSERAAVTTNDEIGLLTSGFNVMVSQLDKMIKDVYELTIRDKESELAALQSQINPHFLYNTLESISMAARRDRNEELSQVIASLGRLLQYTVNKQERLIPLQEELEFVDHYVNIQTFRLENRLQVQVQVDLSYESLLVPKLIVQPLIENAIEHGMGNRPLTITLSTKLIEQDLWISAADNGKGMDAETIARIEQSLSRPSIGKEREQGKRQKGFALWNIHRRIHILYGEPYGLYVDRNVKEGATFHIRIPFNWED